MIHSPPFNFSIRFLNATGNTTFNSDCASRIYFSSTGKAILKTKNAREWTGFPKNAIAIGTDGSGNQIILLHDGDGILKDEIYFWNHELGDIKMLAKTHILSAENTDNSIWQRIKAILKI